MSFTTSAIVQIVQDQKVGRQVAAERLLKGVVGARLAQLSEQLVSPHEQDALAGAHREQARHVESAIASAAG